jgi:MFS family permease
MFSTTIRLLGGYAFHRRELRLLYTATFLSFLGASITFPLRMLYAQAHHADPEQLGLLAASFIVGMLVLQMPMGWLVDRWGRVPVLLLGLITHPILTILYIPLNSPTELIILRFLEGMTVAAVQPATAAFIADVTPEEHRSEAYGALGATLNGGLLLGPLFGGIIAQYFGFTMAFVVNFVVELLALPLVLGRISEPRVHATAEHDRENVPWTAVLSVPLVSAYASAFALQVAFGVLGALWAIWVNDLGGSLTYIGITFSVFALPQIFFGTTAGKLADRFGRAPFLLVSGIIAGCIYASYGLLHNLILIAIIGVIEGIVIVFQMPIAQSLLADASPTRARGRTQGVSGLVGSLGGALAAFVSLPLYHHARPLPFLGAGIIMLIGSGLAALGVMIYDRRKAKAAQGEREVEPALA